MPQTAEKLEQRPQPPGTEAHFNWDDPLDLEGELTPEECMVRDTARGYAQDKLFPRVLLDNREERFDPAIVKEMGALGLLGATLLRRLWIDHAGDRAGGFRLSLRHVGAVFAGDASHLQVRQRGATQQIPAEARNRRDRRLLWPHRARPRFRSGLDGDM